MTSFALSFVPGLAVVVSRGCSARRDEPNESSIGEVNMLTKLLAGAILGVGLMMSALPAANEAASDCCALNLACCEEGAACCAGDAPRCCVEGLACCEAGAACCVGAAPRCCVEGLACCEENQACCQAPASCCAPAKACCQPAAACCASAK